MPGRRFPALLSSFSPQLPDVLHTQFGSFLAFYVIVALAGVSLLWLGGEWRRRRQSARERRHSVHCRLCHHHFRDASHDALVRCPACDVLNERRLPLEI